ncbi:MAG: hypothetical protein KH111_13215 [Bacteroidales bacterium]|nr:hypothetical protein [Bacteroidales bacterium]
MKSFFRILLLIVTMATFCVSTYAQKGDRQRMTREQLAEVQAKYIAKELEMDDVATKQFIETFCQFQKEIWALGPRPKKDISTCTDEEIEQAIKERFAHSQKILNLRQKYYEEYGKFLSQKQIGRVYELERKMMDRLFHRSQKERSQKK